MTPTGRFRVGRSYFPPPGAPRTGTRVTGSPVSLVIALWLVGSMWLVGVGFYYFELPPPMLGGVYIMGLVAALMEWLARSEPPR
jgi:hypothetical protein